jgi:hypothetical protein
MEAAERPEVLMRGHRRLARVLAGIQAGVVASFAILLWMMFCSLLAGDSAWRIPNLLASVFYGPQSLNASFGRIAMAGISLHILQCAAAAVLFSCWMPQASYRRTLFAALAYAAVLAWVAKSFVWRSLSPYLPGMIPTFPLWTGFLLFAFALSLLPWLRQEIEESFLLN